MIHKRGSKGAQIQHLSDGHDSQERERLREQESKEPADKKRGKEEKRGSEREMQAEGNRRQEELDNAVIRTNLFVV